MVSVVGFFLCTIGGRWLAQRDEGADAEVEAFAAGDAVDVFEERALRIGVEARDGEEAAVHLERCSGLRPAIVGGRIG